MNIRTAFQWLNARTISAELTAAARLDAKPNARRIMLRLAHAGATPIAFCVIGPIDMAGAAALHARSVVVAAIAVVSLVCIAVARVAAKAHLILDENELIGALRTEVFDLEDYDAEAAANAAAKDVPALSKLAWQMTAEADTAGEEARP